LVAAADRPATHLKIGRCSLTRLKLADDYMLQITLPEDELQQVSADKQLATARAIQLAKELPAIGDAAAEEIQAAAIAAQLTALEANEQADTADGLIALIDVVNHLNRGQTLVVDIADRLRFAQLNCLAALKVKDTTAFRHALTFALYGIIFLGPPRDIAPLLSAYERAMITADKATASANTARKAATEAAALQAAKAASGIAPRAMERIRSVPPQSLSPIPSESPSPSPSESGISRSSTPETKQPQGGSETSSNYSRDAGSATRGGDTPRAGGGARPHTSTTTTSVGGTSLNIESGSDNDKDARASGHGDDGHAEEGVLVIVPRSDQDYDTAVRGEVWKSTGSRLLALRLYLLRLELEYFTGNQTEGDSFMEVAMLRAEDGAERARLLGIRSVALCQRSQYAEATSSGVAALVHLGITLPEESKWISTAMEEHALIKTKLASSTSPSSSSVPTIENLVRDLPAITSVHDRFLGFILAEMSICAYLSNPPLLALLSTRSILLALEHGLAAEHALMFAWYGLVASKFGDTIWGYRFASLVDAIFTRFPSLRYKGKAMMLINTVINPMHRPWKSTFRSMDAGIIHIHLFILVFVDVSDRYFVCSFVMNSVGYLAANR
jgi:hypothetical protein